MTASLRDFERRLLDEAIQNDPDHEILLAQVLAATVTSRESTGVGLYVALDAVGSPRLACDRSEGQLAGAQRLVISHPRLRHGGGAIVWLEAGRIHLIECFAYSEPWPDDEAGFDIRADEDRDV